MSARARPPRFRRVALLGIGLINGSLALVMRREGLAEVGLTVHPSLANFALIEFEPEGPRSARAASAWLEQDGIIARPMAAYGLPHCLRLSVGLEAENRAVVESLGAFARQA